MQDVINYQNPIENLPRESPDERPTAVNIEQGPDDNVLEAQIDELAEIIVNQLLSELE
jgi:hypothetical protein